VSLDELGDVITALTALVLAIGVLVMHARVCVKIWLRVRREEREAAERRRYEMAKRAQEQKDPMGFRPSNRSP
jgi:hypothetical protein